MSDIYLQITETPTVVTLSAPVISGALSSTVTVANVVTVALDSNSLSALENVTVTVGAAITGTVTVSNFPASQAVTFSAVTISNFPTSQTIAGTVTANLGFAGNYDNGGDALRIDITALNGQALDLNGNIPIKMGTVTAPFPISGTVTVGNTVTIAGTVTANPTGTQTIAGSVTLGAGTENIGVVTIGNIRRSGDYVQSSLLTESGSGYLLTRSTLNAGSEQIGSVTASISGTVPISISSVTVGNSVTIGSLPAISGTVTANTFALQGTAVTTSNFTSTTASTVLANYNATREVLSIFNEGAGNLHICAGATCTTIAYQVRLSAGDYYEVPNHQTTITHSAVFATAGTARVTQVS